MAFMSTKTQRTIGQPTVEAIASTGNSAIDPSALPYFLGRERQPSGPVTHAVPIDDKTNTAVCGARVRVRRSHQLGDSSPIGCPTCAAATADRVDLPAAS